MSEPDDECVTIAVFLEGRFRLVVEAGTRAAATAFAQGYCAAVDHFQRSASLYLLPDDLEEMLRDEHPVETRRAVEESGYR